MPYINFTELAQELNATLPGLMDGERARYTVNFTGKGVNTNVFVVLAGDAPYTQEEVDAVLAAHTPDALELVSNKTSIVGNGTDAATLNLRLTSNDGLTRAQNLTVSLDANGETFDVALTNGLGSTQ